MNTTGKPSGKYLFMLTWAFLILNSIGNAQTIKRYQFEQPKMGSLFQIILYSQDSASAYQIAKKAYLLIDSLNHIFSDYEPESELSKLSYTAGSDSFVKISPILYNLLKESRKAWQASEGKFDITIGPLSRVWREARKANHFPADSLIQRSKAKTGMQFLKFDPQNHAVKLKVKGMKLDMGGIAKGFIAQYILDFLREKGFPVALTNAGGDIACGEAPPGKKGWSVAVTIPMHDQVLPSNLFLENKSIATSGNMYQFIEHDGKKYSHEIDPQTGYGIQSQRNVTVISPEAGLSDWLATACSILSIKKSKKLVRRFGAEILILEIKNGKLRHYRSKGFPYL